MSGFTRQRSNGRWQARFKPRRGKQISKDFPLKREAEAWLAEQQVSDANGTRKKASELRVGDLYSEWHKRKSLEVSRKAIEGYESLWNSRVAPHWKDRYLDELNYGQVRDWQVYLAQECNLSNSRITQAYQVLCMVVDFALENEWIQVNKLRKPAGSRKNTFFLKTKPSRKVHVLSPDEIWRAAEAAGYYQLFILFLGMIGLRFSEAAALKLQDFDTERHELTIQRQLSCVRGGPIEIPPKGGRSRTIKIPDVIWPLVEARLKIIHPEQYFCSTEHHRILRNQNFHRGVWKPLKEKLGIPASMTLHDLRHSAVTNLVEDRYWPTAVSGMSGHSSLDQTLTRYTHVTSKTVTETAAKLDELYSFAACDKVVTTSTVTKRTSKKLHEKSNVYIARSDAPVAQRGKSNGFLNLSTDEDES